VSRKTLGNSGGGINSAVPNGQAEVKPRGVGRAITEPAATGRITSETSGRIAEAELGAGAASGRNRRTANLAKHQPRTRRQPLPAKADITDTQTPIYQEAMPTGTGAGTGLADVLRAIAALSDADRELLIQLVKALTYPEH